jgi:branched-chain amino acid transport system substrate-binding protein
MGMSDELKRSEAEGGRENGAGRLDVSRRQFLKAAGVLGATVGLAGGLGGVIAACGSDGTTSTTAGSQAVTTSTEAAAASSLPSTTSVSAGPEAGREIKIGSISPVTGSLAVFGQAEEWSRALALKTLGDGIVLGDGKKHRISIEVADTQSDAQRAAQVTADLVMNGKADILVVSGTPDTVNPACDQAETLECPLVAVNNPWQAFIFGRGANLDTEYKWIYGVFFGADQEVGLQDSVFKKIPSNKKLAVLLNNTTDGNTFAQLWVPAFEALGYEVTFPDQYLPGAEDFTAQIAAFKKAGCELLTGQQQPPDFTNFWKQSIQQGFTPKLVNAGGMAFANFKFAEALGVISVGFTAGFHFHRSFPYVDSLTGMTCAELCDDYEKATGQQWAATLSVHGRLSWAIDVLKRAKNPEDKQSIVEAIRTTNTDLIWGKTDFTAPVDKAGRRITPNVYIPDWALVQCVRGADAKPTASKWPFDANVVAVDGHPGVQVIDPITQQYA